MRVEAKTIMAEMIITFYAKGESPPKRLESGQIIRSEKIFGAWWKLLVITSKDRIQDVAEELRKHGMTPAQSPNYR